MIEMTNYFNIFDKDADYETFKGGEKYVTPNICLMGNENTISYKHHIPYLTFEAIEDTTFKLTQNACEYSLNYGGVWLDLPANTETPTVPAGSKIMFKCTNPSISSSYGIGTFMSTGEFNISGNIMSMLYGDDFTGQTDLTSKNYAFKSLFNNCTKLVDASELILPASTLATACYWGMFSNCTSLTSAPELPATILANGCYYWMFMGCTSLVNAPELPATTLANGCYSSMFYNCTSLVTAPELPATILANGCYSSMFYNCTRLTTAPELLATTLADTCYNSMFRNCSCLNNITMLATDISASKCLTNWVNGVANTGIFTKHNNMPSLPTGVNGIPEGWEVKNHITPTECTSLTITADDVIGNDTTTTIYYTATCNGVDYKGNTVTGFIAEGTAVSAEFPQNTSETETVERTITFEFLGVTASTVIRQGVWVNPSYTIDLNNQWELSSTISNPDSSLYDGVYQSSSNKGVDNSAALMYIDIEGYTSFKFYVRSYAEDNYDYVVVSNLDSTLTKGTTGGTAVKMTTSGKQNGGTSIDSYQLVEFTDIDMGAHRITVMYRKDGSGNTGDDRGYVLIPKN